MLNKSPRFHSSFLKVIGKIFISSANKDEIFISAQCSYNVSRNEFLFSESIRDKLEQIKSEIENNISEMEDNIRGEMKEMKERLDTLTASLEENRDEGKL